MVRILKIIVSSFFEIVLLFIGTLPKKVQTNLLENSLTLIEKYSNKRGFWTRMQFIQSSSKIKFLNDNSEGGDKLLVPTFGILIQGPIITISQLNTVSDTIKLYLDNYPTCFVVLSTWKNPLMIDQFFIDSPRFHLILNEDPGVSWPSNLLRQIVSTNSGLKLLKSFGIQFAIKSRTDQRMLRENLPSILLELLEIFPNRIFYSSYGSGKYRIFGLSDQWQFGRIDQLIEYWDYSSVEEMQENIRNSVYNGEPELRQLSIAVHEVILNVNYLLKLKFKVSWTWESYLMSLRSYFAILDSDFISLQNLGRNRTVIDHVHPNLSNLESEVNSHISFIDWISILHRANTDFPKLELMILAMKVPSSDFDNLINFWDLK